MSAEYLDITGLTYFWNKLKSYIADLLADKADDSDVVHLAGTETIAGSKSFTASTTVIDGDVVRSGDNAHLRFSGGTGAAVAAHGAYLNLYGSTRSSSPGLFILCAGTSSSDYARMLGTPDGTLTWNGSTIQTSSDERLKTPLFAVPDDVLDAWEAVNWGQFQFLSAVERKGESARLHLGLIAQRVKAVFEARGLNACAYGILCHEEREADGEEPAVDLWMVRYEEALAMEVCCQRRRADRLEARLSAIEERLNQLS